MEILSATFAENIDVRQGDGGATRLDLTGVHFSIAAPSPPPVTITPHLIVLVRCREGESDFSALEVVFTNQSGEQVARSVMPFQVEPGKFGFRLVRAELTFDDYGTIEAHCQLDDGPETVVPLTLIPRP